MPRLLRPLAFGFALLASVPSLAVEPEDEAPWLTFGASSGIGLGPHSGHLDMGARLGVDLDFWPARWLTVGLHAGTLGVISVLKDDGYAGALAAKLGLRVPFRRVDLAFELMAGPGYRKGNHYCPLFSDACEDWTESGRVLYLGASAGLLIKGHRGVQVGPTLRYDRYDGVNAFTLGAAVVLPLVLL